ncbi:hypothetical protein EDB19DRAFT_2035562 [Suillus lakei]|nr:hypothetical protein EDB19DRAFT_2035562 [Suillus lakei]
MSVIEKLQETWTSNSITTLFRLGTLAATSTPLQSPAAGFSWRFMVVRTMTRPLSRGGRIPSPRWQLVFNSCDCPGAWLGTPVNVTVSFPSHPSFCTTSIAAVLGNQPLILCPDLQLEGVQAQVLISLEVTFTNPLTCNLFNVLAVRPGNVGSVPDAPASAEEPRVPQGRSALRALEQSLKTGTSFDIVFQAYTRCLSPGRVTRPSPIYASTTVMQTTTLLPDFSEEDLDGSSLFDLSECGTLPFTSLERYEYESDSDLDDVDNAESHEDTTDSGSISSFSSIEAGLQEQPDNRPSLLEDVEMIGENLKRGYRVVLVKGVAWRTWHAFVYYCYTGTIIFANLRSQSIPDVTPQPSRLEGGPPSCSPKSMYQLARKLHNEPLSQLALKAIETRLFAANILDEGLSKFTSRHDAVREMEIALLVKHRSATEVMQGLPIKMEAVVMGNLPHAAPVLTALYQQISQIPGQN